MEKIFVKVLIVVMTAWGMSAPLPVRAESGQGIDQLISESVFDEIFSHRNEDACPAHGFYAYRNLLEAAAGFPEFASTGDRDVRKRELAAFLAQVGHETTGGWATAPDGPYAWGLCFKEEVNPPSDYCANADTEWPCVPGKSYHGRGPIRLSWNYNYGPVGRAVGADLLGDPDLVASDGVISWKTALWFWMTPRPPKPSAHDVMAGTYVPTPQDMAAHRVAGFGLTTNIINGGVECGRENVPEVADRIGFYRRIAGILVVDAGANLDCEKQEPYS